MKTSEQVGTQLADVLINRPDQGVGIYRPDQDLVGARRQACFLSVVVAGHHHHGGRPAVFQRSKELHEPCPVCSGDMITEHNRVVAIVAREPV